MVYRNVEETLNLVGMQVHGNQTVDTCHTQQVSHQFGTDRNTRFVFSVLASPSEVRDNGYDALGRSSFCCVNHQQQFHQVVRIRKGRLN